MVRLRSRKRHNVGGEGQHVAAALMVFGNEMQMPGRGRALLIGLWVEKSVNMPIDNLVALAH
jgi:hypothetical protein